MVAKHERESRHGRTRHCESEASCTAFHSSMGGLQSPISAPPSARRACRGAAGREQGLDAEGRPRHSPADRQRAHVALP